jgi:hypothetical protein
MTRLIAVALLVALSAAVHAETVDVKYRGLVDLNPFVCTNTVSSLGEPRLLRQEEHLHADIAEHDLVSLLPRLASRR